VMAVRREVFVRLAELPCHPESPRSDLGSGHHQRPGSIRIGHHRMSVVGTAVPGRERPEVLVSGRRFVDISTAEDEGDEVPRVVVERPIVVRSQPLVQPHRSPGGLDPPADDVGTVRQAEPFRELDDDWSGGKVASLRSPLDPSGAHTRLSCPQSAQST